MKWILNSGRKDNTENENKMLKLNREFIGFGTPDEKREILFYPFRDYSLLSI